MKKICLTIAFIICSLPAFAVTPMANLAIIENSLFGYENKTATQNQRLEKIESTIYGSIQKNTLDKRLKKINTDLGINLSDYISETHANSNLDADVTTKYPIVDKMETRIFKKNFQGENIYKRLDRLETKAFGSKSLAPLNSRVEKLAQTINVENTSDYKNIVEKPDYSYFNEEDNIETPQNETKNTVPTIQRPIPQSINFTLNTMEQQILNKTYPQESNDERISRMEKKLLHKNFSGNDDKTRLDRLSAVAEAKKTTPMYDDNKWSKTLSTGMQVGGILLMILTMLI